MRNRTPTLRQLQILQALAEYKNISLVAENLYISQPSVSIQLKKLSELFDTALYRVNGKKVKLTEEGMAVLKASNDIFSTLNKLSSKLDDIKGVKSGKLKLSVVSTAKSFLPLLLGSFCKKYPQVDVELNIGNRAQILANLKDNKDDFYVLSDCFNDKLISVKPFLDNPLMLVAPENHELTRQANISLTRLTHYPFIMREIGSGTRMSIDLFCQSNKITLQERMTIESNEAIKQAVVADLGLAILSKHTLNNIANSGLVILNVDNFPIKSTWYLAQNKQHKQSVLGKLFYDFMQNEGKSELLKFS